jgi:hypothetical protein
MLGGYEKVCFECVIVLMEVDVTIQGGERKVVERQWHRGDMPLEHVLNISSRPTRVLPP